ncbi:hypothetical protein BJ508DRAFT_86367 [Ascobolus immersus RN42]|uniref:Uncharacterized protein n=1 Tax=Ascobolus immersus RN42 TaxID=1160509 RepID=A0A3N4I938_ASCIM|nr:hypothetical protein BJ508DRAFT_86367 [Ascobolus immersus RN42]
MHHPLLLLALTTLATSLAIPTDPSSASTLAATPPKFTTSPPPKEWFAIEPTPGLNNPNEPNKFIDQSSTKAPRSHNGPPKFHPSIKPPTSGEGFNIPKGPNMKRSTAPPSPVKFIPSIKPPGEGFYFPKPKNPSRRSAEPVPQKGKEWFAVEPGSGMHNPNNPNFQDQWKRSAEPAPQRGKEWFAVEPTPGLNNPNKPKPGDQWKRSAEPAPQRGKEWFGVEPSLGLTDPNHPERPPSPMKRSLDKRTVCDALKPYPAVSKDAKAALEKFSGNSGLPCGVGKTSGCQRMFHFGTAGLYLCAEASYTVGCKEVADMVSHIIESCASSEGKTLGSAEVIGGKMRNAKGEWVKAEGRVMVMEVEALEKE